MAESPAHKFGQIIGALLEAVIEPALEDFCQSQGLYLDHQSKKRLARRRKKVSWEDHYGNTHDLDFVIERDGSDREVGQPLAFIEVAWRRYTKHSRNKAQEIQGAILPLAEKYRLNNPFLGVVLAGMFTSGSLEQLQSLGFQILYFPYDTLVAAFASEGFIIEFDEATEDAEFRRVIDLFEVADNRVVERVKQELIRLNATQIEDFLTTLQARLARFVTKVNIIPLYGRVNEFVSIEGAIDFLNTHPIYEGSGHFRKYEILVEFSNGDKIDASFSIKEKARQFLEFVATQ